MASGPRIMISDTGSSVSACDTRRSIAHRRRSSNPAADVTDGPDGSAIEHRDVEVEEGHDGDPSLQPQEYVVVTARLDAISGPRWTRSSSGCHRRSICRRGTTSSMAASTRSSASRFAG